MGMNTHVYGLVDRNKSPYPQMLAVVEACKAANLKPPMEVIQFFKDRGGSWDYPEEALRMTVPVTQGGGDMTDYWDVDVTNLPKDVVTIRFINSY